MAFMDDLLIGQTFSVPGKAGGLPLENQSMRTCLQRPIGTSSLRGTKATKQFIDDQSRQSPRIASLPPQ
jgi:hypothetical protein